MHAHGRAQLDERRGFRAGLVAVQANAQAHHVEAHVGVADGGGGVRAVHDTGVDARRAQPLDGLDVAFRLDMEVERFRAIRRGEVREHALKLERAMEADLVHEVHHFVPAHADAVHARVDGQMIRRAQPHGVCSLRILDGELGRVHRRHDLVGKQQRDSAGRRLGKHENRSVDQAFAQFDALVDRGDAQVIGAGVQRRLRNAHRTVAVCVCLHNGHHVTTRADHLLDGGGVVADGVQVDFQPGPAAILLRDGGQLLGVELHTALGVFAVCGI